MTNIKLLAVIIGISAVMFVIVMVVILVVLYYQDVKGGR